MFTEIQQLLEWLNFLKHDDRFIMSSLQQFLLAALNFKYFVWEE